MKFDQPAGSNPVDRLQVVGRPIDRIDGVRKVCGTAGYAYERHDVVARPAYATPLTTTEPIPVGGSEDRSGVADWTIERGYADATGRRLSGTEFYELEDAANRAGTNLNQFLHARGIQRFGVYHPADRFWTFQLIEAVLFVAVAAVLIGVVVWRVRRRLI